MKRRLTRHMQVQSLAQRKIYNLYGRSLVTVRADSVEDLILRASDDGLAPRKQELAC